MAARTTTPERAPVTATGRLSELRIRGLGAIDDVTLELGRGLTVVTGETGAGKTMVVTGLTLLFGGRADPGRVRASGRAGVEGRLELPPESPAWARAADAGADPDDDGSLILARTVSAEGRSRAYLGGRSVPVGVVAELAESLLAVHGQTDQLRLSRPAEQRRALDRYAGAEHLALLERYRAAHQRWRELAADLDRRRGQARELAQAADVLRHGLEEIADVAPEPGEDEALDTQAKRLGDADALRAAADEARMALVGDVTGDLGAGEVPQDAAAALAIAERALAGSDDPTLVMLAQDLADAVAVVSDVAGQLAGYVADLDADPARLAEVLDRRAALTALVRKYADPGAGVGGVLAWAEDAAHRLAQLDVSDEALEALAAERDAVRAEVDRLGSEISAGRRAAADGFAAEVGSELAGLAMKSAQVSFSIDSHPDDPGPEGIDEVALLLAAHPGAPPRPVHKGASGGELSRVMLAIEVVFAGADPVPVMVFDEVDAGVGGQAAGEIGRRLARLARDHQVVVVTHLAQVAAFADTHLVVDKAPDTGAGVTATDIRSVDGEDRVRELARMLSGLADSDTGQAHARELLAVAASAR
ncbi:DNA repair protein RecN [Blastococcus sp. MG754426]|uniref:DNA repair protein RecN n=1 Tax=Blastococcus sp. KM273129 TaxID=2570315 RepID=UPI001F003762|nr:DNA repair protein RecN [Blastococcus sp. KM273129]MCF6508592.1 DNA repair protein RecN [Blastococcus sp. MG754426]MCF6513170.1 DNA repair protein RecN [Blastococcus sp. MG754427]MCF6736020.1 DNA repair protein RecN [Blastococcus sp. KM273129]